MHFGRYAYHVFVALLVVSGNISTAHAQQNKPIRSGTWYEDRAVQSQSANTITLQFAQAPTDKFLNITNVACEIDTSIYQAVGGVFLTGGTTSGATDLDRAY